MAVFMETKLELRTMIPPFELMSADGQPVNLWDFKGLKNMVLVFVPEAQCPPCMEFLRSSVNAYHQYEAENTVLLPVIVGSMDTAILLRDELHPPFPILYDELGQVAMNYTDYVPSIFVADKFGELYAQWHIGPEMVFPSQKNILDVVELINLECPECGAPVEWATPGS